MADMQVKENLTLLDSMSIITYRAGMLCNVLSLTALALQQLYYPLWYKHVLVWFAFSVFLQAANLHIYNKSVRMMLVTSAWLGVWLVSLSFVNSGVLVAHVSLACLLACCAGISYKESFCFSLTALKVNPILLIALYCSLILASSLYAAIFAGLSAALTAYMVYKKCRMPLYYDLGDRSKYQY